MQIRVFNIPTGDAGRDEPFSGRSKDFGGRAAFFQNENGACWSFCVRYLMSNTGTVVSASFVLRRNF